jgi:hypothetical protein
MMRNLRLLFAGLAMCAVLLGVNAPAQAGTIINLVSAPPAIAIQYNGTTLSTAGPQNTPAIFTDFLDSFPDIVTPTASFTFGGITKSGSPFVNGTSIIQQFSGGTLSLYDSNPTLLLSANLGSSALTGTAGLANGGLFTTSFSNVTGGTLAAQIDHPTLVFQMHLYNINGGAGLSTAVPAGGGLQLLTLSTELQPFTANATANLDAGQGQVVPEPATIVLAVISLVLTLAFSPLSGQVPKCAKVSP